MNKQVRTSKYNTTMRYTAKVLGLFLAGCVAGSASAFDSGSNGADGALSPSADTVLPMPADGIFNFTTVDIPAGVTVTFARNPQNPNVPVRILANGDVTVAGTIDVSGTDGSSVNQGNLALVLGRPPGGPGGFAGGLGGLPGLASHGSDGLGPGGGKGAACGAGGSYASEGDLGGSTGRPCTPAGSPTYGASKLLPLIGGSGGGGGGGDDGTTTSRQTPGASGGGGGGAILIAASGTVTVSGAILARGGAGGGISAPAVSFGGGGGGSGGAIRIVATTITGEGTLDARGGVTGGPSGSFSPFSRGGAGGDGRIRLEAENLQRSAPGTPLMSISTPKPVTVAGMPSLRIIRVAGVDVPAFPSGEDDVALPSTVANPVTVDLVATDVPIGNTVTVTVTPRSSDSVNTLSTPLAGTAANATASATVTLPQGVSILQATVSFTVTAAIGDALKNYAKGERVERIELAAASGAASQTTLITVSGKRYVWSGGRAIN